MKEIIFAAWISQLTNVNPYTATAYLAAAYLATAYLATAYLVTVVIYFSKFSFLTSLGIGMSDINFVKHLRFRTDLQNQDSFLFEIELEMKPLILYDNDFTSIIDKYFY